VAVAEQVPLRFGQYEIDPKTLVLQRDGELVPLAPKPAAVLALLASRAGQVVLREEIFEAVWPGQQFGLGLNLNTCIKQVRAALGETAGGVGFIRTLPRRGYLLDLDAAIGEPKPALRSRLVRHRGLVAASTLAAATILAVVATHRADHSAIDQSARDLFQRARARTIVGGSDSAPGALRELAAITERYPRFVPGLEALGRTYLQLGYMDSARAVGRRILRTDRRSFEAYLLLANAALGDLDWQGADRAHKAAIRLAGAMPAVHLSYANQLSMEGRHAEALGEVSRTLELDPITPSLLTEAGWVHLRAGRYSSAADWCGRALQMGAEESKAARCRMYGFLLQGDSARGLADMNNVFGVTPSNPGAVPPSRHGEAEDIRRVWQTLRATAERSTPGGGLSSYVTALAAVGLNDVSGAVEALELWFARDACDRAWFVHDPRFAALSDDLRFRRLVQRTGLVAPWDAKSVGANTSRRGLS
jgi:DNA-binding winged helix-turn-helix (wHTH) protein